MNQPFWETKSLHELTNDEWEALCDGCGLCCLHRIQDEDEEDAPILLTRVVCRCYDLEKGQCGDYANRFMQVEGCVPLTPTRAAEFDWLPETCAYRRRYRNLPLPLWHPLISKNPISVRPYSLYALDPVLEDEETDLEEFVIEKDEED